MTQPSASDRLARELVQSWRDEAEEAARLKIAADKEGNPVLAEHHHARHGVLRLCALQLSARIPAILARDAGAAREGCSAEAVREMQGLLGLVCLGDSRAAADLRERIKRLAAPAQPARKGEACATCKALEGLVVQHDSVTLSVFHHGKANEAWLVEEPDEPHDTMDLGTGRTLAAALAAAAARDNDSGSMSSSTQGGIS